MSLANTLQVSTVTATPVTAPIRNGGHDITLAWQGSARQATGGLLGLLVISVVASLVGNDVAEALGRFLL